MGAVRREGSRGTCVHLHRASGQHVCNPTKASGHHTTLTFITTKTAGMCASLPRQVEGGGVRGSGGRGEAGGVAGDMCAPPPGKWTPYDPGLYHYQNGFHVCPPTEASGHSL